MNRLAKSAISFGAGAFALGILLLAAPRAAHAIAATAVLVENTPSAPVPNLDVERNARVPYQSTGSCLNALSYCGVFLTSPPTGYRLITESVSVWTQSPAGTVPPIGYIDVSPSKAVLAGGFVSSGYSGLNQRVSAYIEGGQNVYVYVLNGGASTNITLFGHLQNCSVSTCFPIQQ